MKICPCRHFKIPVKQKFLKENEDYLSTTSGLWRIYLKGQRYSNRHVVCGLRKSRCVALQDQLFASWPLKLAELLMQYKSTSYSRQVISCVPSPPMILPGPARPL